MLYLGLPGLDGLDVARDLRRESSVPLVMLTARGDESDKLVGLELGADDYVVKPFSPKELVARARAVLRRARPREVTPVLAAGSLRLDSARHVVEIGGGTVDLTAKEFGLLEAFLSSGGRVLSREQLLTRIWGYDHADEIESRTVDVHIRRLRAKLGDEGRRIATVTGVGYRLE